MRIGVVALTLLAGLLAVEVTVFAADWPHWRGPNRNGISSETSGVTDNGWLDRSPAWRHNAGEGSTSPIVVGERLFMLGWHDGQDSLVCLNVATGKELWRVSYNSPRYGRHATGDEGLYSGPTASPEFDTQTGKLYTLGCDGDLICWDTAQEGMQVWHLNLYESYKVPQRPRVGRSGLRDYGYTTAPLVHGNWLIVEVGAASGTLVAFDKTTGKEVWQSEAKGPAGHTGGLVPMTVDGVPCVAVLTFKGMLVTRLDGENAGKTVSEYEWITDFINNIATPAVLENHVLITSGYNHNAICKLEVTLAGARQLWQQPLASKVCSPVIHKGHVYWAWQTMRCLDFETGQQRWQGGRFGDAGSCILTSDDRLIVWGGRGTLVLVDTVERSSAKYNQLAGLDNVFDTDVWPHVVLANRRVFVKDRVGNLACFEMLDKNAPGKN